MHKNGKAACHAFNAHDYLEYKAAALMLANHDHDMNKEGQKFYL